MAVNMTITPGPDSLGPAGQTLIVYNKRAFSYTFTPSVAYDAFQVSGTAAADFNTSTGLFSNPNGYSPAGSTYTLNVNAIQARQSTATPVFIAGSTPGYTNGTGAAAQFNYPRGFAITSSGDIYVSDTNNHVIRKVTQSGVVTTFAGSGVAGYADNANPLLAQFNFPTALVLDGSENLYVVDYGNLRIRKITPSGEVTTLAGSGLFAVQDGTGASASFAFSTSLPDITIDPSGTLYVSDNLPPFGYIRKITPAGDVTTIYGNYLQIYGIGYDGTGNLFFGDFDIPNGNLKKLNLSTSVVTLIFSNISVPFSIVFDEYGTLFMLTGNEIAKLFNQTILSLTSVSNQYQLALYKNQLYGGGSGDTRVYKYQIQVDVQPSVSTLTDVVVATSLPLTLNVTSRISSSESPPIFNGTAQLYKYEPFSYQYAALLTGDALVLTTAPEILAFTSSNTVSVAFQSTAGYQTSYTNVLTFNLQVVSNSIVQETRSYNVQVNPGRFFPPLPGSAYIFYQNEPIDPIELDSVASITQVFSSPSLPIGLSIVQADPLGNVWNIQGTPSLRSVPINYQLIGQNASNGRVVTATTNITVSGERLRLYVNDVFNFSNAPVSVSSMVDGNAISSQIVTAQFPGTPAFAYQWSPSLLNGIQFTNVSGNAISSPFIPMDASETIILSGTPSVNALKSLAFSGLSNYTVTLQAKQARPSGTISNSIPFVFSFVESVLFTADPYTKTQYVGVPITVADNVFFQAKTYFGNTSNVLDIYSPDLRSDLSINFNSGLQRAYLVSATGPSYASVDTFTLRAVNSNGITRDASLTIQTIPDSVTWDYSTTPAFDACLNFIYSRALSNGKPGYYPSPLQFSAKSASGQPITYYSTGFEGTGITLAGNTLTGIPLVVAPLTTATITAIATTGALNTTNIRYTILDDVIDFSGSSFPTNFYQNITIEPSQTITNVLSGRPITLYSATGFPAGITISPTGLISGTPAGDMSGTYTITATTGYKSESWLQDYSLTPDSILFIIDPKRYYIPPGSNVPSNIQYTLLSFSGTRVSNAAILPTNPTTFGVLMDTQGDFYGTMSTCIPPNPIVPTDPQRVPYTVSASAGYAIGTAQFVISSLNGNGSRIYTTLQNSPTGNVLYYSIPTSLAYAPSSTEYDNFTTWIPASLTLPSGAWASRVTTDPLASSTAAVVVAANNITNGYLMYSLDGITFSNAIVSSNAVVTNILKNSSWYGVGAESGNVYLYESADGITWNNAAQVPVSTRTGTGSAYETYGLALSINPSNANLFVGGTGGQITTNNGLTWTPSTLITGEVAGAYYDGPDLLVYGSEYFTTSVGIGAFIPSPTMRGSYNNGPSITVPGEFNAFCYSVVKDNTSGYFFATGIQYDGTGYVPQLRASPSAYGPYAVVDLSSNPLFTASPTPSKPPIEIGPVFFDSVSVHVFVSREISPGSSVLELYIHDRTPPFTNWQLKSSVAFESMTPVPQLTSISEFSKFISDSNCLPYLDFTQPGNPEPPVFTEPTQLEYIAYQYITIQPFAVTAVPGGMSTGPVYLFAQPNDIPPGLRFSQFANTVYGRPARDGIQTLKIYALDVSNGAYSVLTITFNVLIPRVIRRQDGAGAYTTLLRNYVEVNGAQNARDSRVYPSETQRQGIFAAPLAPDVISAPEVNPKCCDPNA